MNLAQLIRRPEGKTLEFKRDLSSPEKVLRTVVAFANTSGGTILIGIDDSTGDLRGVLNAREEEERLANLISDSVSPQLVPYVELLRYREKTVLGVEVYPSSNRPHYLGDSAETGSYVRIGSTNRRADGELVAEMRRVSRGEAFDEQPIPELDSEAIDMDVFSELFAEFRRVSDLDLDTLGILTSYQGRRVPTIGGVLLFGGNRLEHFPDAWIQVGRFGGFDRSHISEQIELRRPLPLAIEEAYRFIERHIASGVDIRGLRGLPRWQIPPLVVREALINAIVHADYSQRGAPFRISIFDDRLEIENPGLLPFGLTLDDLPLGVSKLRNRVIGRIFHELKLIEQWGSGIVRMINACQQAGIPNPVWQELGNRFRVTMKKQYEFAPTIDTVDDPICEVLSENDGLRTSEIADATSLSARATRIRLKKLVEEGLVVRTGTSPTDPQARYFLAAI
ncbi:MAG: helix-turn-helix domain-containing protein [Gammaproteobacteria bacterium]|nr:helix-turn-helix domain-containing protein [Gammaproteobacteria bacterium]